EGFTRVFDCHFSDASDALAARPKLIKDHADIPQLWDAYPNETWTYVSDVSVKPASGPTHFKAIVTYVSTPDPLNEDPEITWSFAVSNEPVDRDIDGKPLVNSAGESFDPPITKDANDIVLHIVRNEAGFNSIVADNYKGAVNGDMFFGFGPGRVKCININGVKTRAAALTFWQVTYEFQFRRWQGIPNTPNVGWIRRILDEGFREKTGVEDGKAVYAVITDASDNKLSQPVLLDGNGKILADGADAVFLEFNLNRM
ncbi:unnamed protein product, partial [marine sediment metagenome]